jgi:hypothetical protein
MQAWRLQIGKTNISALSGFRVNLKALLKRNFRVKMLWCCAATILIA